MNKFFGTDGCHGNGSHFFGGTHFHANPKKQYTLLQHSKHATCIVNACTYKLSRGIFTLQAVCQKCFLKTVDKFSDYLDRVHECAAR